MDRDAIIEQGKSELFRNGHTEFDSDTLEYWADEGPKWLSRKHPELWFWKTIDITTFASMAASTTQLDMPADFNVMIHLWDLTNDKELERRELDDIRADYGASWSAGNTIAFYEAGSADVGGGDIRARFGLFRPLNQITDLEVCYYRHPTAMATGASAPDLPIHFHDFCVQFLVNRGAWFIEDDNLAKSSWMQVYDFIKQIGKQHQRRVKRKNWIGERRSSRIVRSAGRRYNY